MGDICRALSTGVLPYCDEIMTVLLENLSNNEVHRTVKPQILSVFGDVALAVGHDFKKYLEVVLQTLMQASQAQVDRVRKKKSRFEFHESFKLELKLIKNMLPLKFSQSFKLSRIHLRFLLKFDDLFYFQNDYDMLDYLNELREGCLEAYTGIIQGMKGDSNGNTPELTLVQPHVPYIVQFITTIAQDPERSDGSVAASAGLIG